MKKTFMIGLSVAGTIIGAGFTTGKEIMLFFPEKGLSGLLSLIISVLIMIIIAVIYCYKEKNRIDKVFEYVFILFVASTFSVMLSCGGETIKETFGIPLFIGSVITYIISLLVTHFNLKGIYVFNLIATPLMIFFTIFVSLKGLTENVFYNSSSSLLPLSYSGYNLLSLIPFLATLKSKETDRKLFIKGLITGLTAVLICGIFIKLVTDKYTDILINAEIPMLKIALTSGNFQNICYTAFIYSAILTTAISSIFALKEKGNIYIITLPLLLISFFGFDSLIKNIYGFFGYIGTGFIIYILISEIFYKSERNGYDYGK